MVIFHSYVSYQRVNIGKLWYMFNIVQLSYLVGGAMCPSWKIMEFVNGKDNIPYMKWKMKFMFETTNQYGDENLRSEMYMKTMTMTAMRISGVSDYQWNLTKMDRLLQKNACSKQPSSTNTWGFNFISGGLLGKSGGNFRIAVKMPPSYLACCSC